MNLSVNFSHAVEEVVIERMKNGPEFNLIMLACLINLICLFVIQGSNLSINQTPNQINIHLFAINVFDAVYQTTLNRLQRLSYLHIAIVSSSYKNMEIVIGVFHAVGVACSVDLIC